MLVALSAQRYPLRFQNFLHARQARSDHRVVQRFADHAGQVQPQLSSRDFPSILALGTLVHGGLLLLPNPIFRSGEECRHSNLNNLQDIAEAAANFFSEPSGTRTRDPLIKRPIPLVSPANSTSHNPTKSRDLMPPSWILLEALALSSRTAI